MTVTHTNNLTQTNIVIQTDTVIQSVTPPPQTITLPVTLTVIKSVTSTQTATLTAPGGTNYQTSTATPPTVTITYPPVTIYSPPPTTSYSPPPPTTGIGRSIIITYSGATATQIGTGSFPVKPASGNVFLVVNMTIQNQGYASFSAMDQEKISAHLTGCCQGFCFPISR